MKVAKDIELMQLPASSIGGAEMPQSYVRKAFLGTLMIAIPLIITGLLLWEFAPPYIVRLTYAALISVIVVVGLQVFMGNSGVANFGHTVFMGIGAYTFAVLATPVTMKIITIPDAPFGLSTFSLSPWLAIPIAYLVVFILALLTGLIIVRVSGIAAEIVTLSLQIIVYSIFIQWTNLFKGNQAFFGIPEISSVPAILAVTFFVILAARLFKDSPSGVQLRASSQNMLAARSFGVDVPQLRLRAWILGALISGTAGIMFASFLGAINAKSFYLNYVFLTFAMLLLGGIRSVSGAAIGVVVMSVAVEFIRWIENGPTIAGVTFPQLFGLSGLALGAVIVGCMILRPQGIMGNLELDDLIAKRRQPEP